MKKWKKNVEENEIVDDKVNCQKNLQIMSVFHEFLFIIHLICKYDINFTR